MFGIVTYWLDAQSSSAFEIEKQNWWVIEDAVTTTVVEKAVVVTVAANMN